jgi:fluoride ion exporter CrcB/FEX
MILRVPDSSLGFAVLALGGGVGCAARAAIREWLVAQGVTAAAAIFAMNLLGSALAGLVIGGATHPASMPRIAAIAVLSGWTTYSAFSTDVVAAVRERRFARAAVLWIGTVVATPVLAWIAARVAAGGFP